MALERNESGVSRSDLYVIKNCSIKAVKTTVIHFHSDCFIGFVMATLFGEQLKIILVPYFLSEGICLLFFYFIKGV